MLKPQRILYSDEWNNSIQQLPNPHILQSWEWGDFKGKNGWDPTRILLSDQSRVCAAVRVLRRPLPRTPFGVVYVPKGPVLDFDSPTIFDSTLVEIERLGRERHAIFCRIDPDIPVSPERDSLALAVLKRRGWRSAREQIQFKNTVLLDLKPDEVGMLAAMKPKTRYNIRLAQKRGVEIVLGTRSDLELFYSMYAETSARDGFLIRQFPYYREAWGAFIDAGLAQMFLARLGQETLAGLILFVFGKQAWYFYGASTSAHRDLMPNYLLQWQAIRWARARGCTIYDFWGAPDTLDENAPMFGVYRFKEGFGGKFKEHIGAFDLILNRPLHFLYAVVRPWYLARLRSRHARTIPSD